MLDVRLLLPIAIVLIVAGSLGFNYGYIPQVAAFWFIVSGLILIFIRNRIFSISTTDKRNIRIFSIIALITVVVLVFVLTPNYVKELWDQIVQGLSY